MTAGGAAGRTARRAVSRRCGGPAAPTPRSRPMLPRTTALLAAAALAAPAAAAAQTTVTGIVVDSTRAAAPLAGATVQLVSRADPTVVRTIATDSIGTYLLADVAPGEYLVGFLHPRLDALALQPPLRLVRAADTVPVIRVDLAVPGGRAIADAICGARPDSTGLLIGHVLDAAAGGPVEGARVTLTWPELVIGGGQVRTERRTLAPPVTADGRYVACGVPTDVPVLARATAGAMASGDVELQVAPFAVEQRDLLVAPVIAVRDSTLPPGVEPPRRGTARLTGRVRRADGAPMARSVVALYGTGATDTTDASGAFALDSLPAGTFMVEARRIGFTPRRIAVDLVGERTTSADVTLDERLPVLETQTVYGKAQRRGSLDEFMQRAQSGFGHFVTPADIERRNAFATTDFMRMMPGVRIVPTGGTGNMITVRGQASLQGHCVPDVFMDGVLMQDGALELDRLVNVQDIGAMEVYTGLGSVPQQYLRGNCGAVVVWTKGRLR